ncbi:MAG: hypothetical protein M1827_002076 [Pycnora praestabilis]|nr:MAG: hypothetical protein M1827_002076 [Pycnora praestabilis]
MASHLSNGATNGAFTGATLSDLPKSHTFTSSLPPDPAFPIPLDSHEAPRQKLGPRMVKGALYTFVRPETTKEPELLAVSERAMNDIGLKKGEEETEDFKALVAGNKLLEWDEEAGEGIYPWAQCYGGWQFGSWAGQLGDGRAISLFESTNPSTQTRYEIQLKGAGKTPYSRFADGKAVLRSSIREFVVSEALNALRIPTTRAMALTLLPHEKVRRERTEPGAIVARFAQSWLRIGTFDILRARGDRDLVRKLSIYIAENVFKGWESLPAKLAADDPKTTALETHTGIPAAELEGAEGDEENRFARLYREIVRRNAKTVAAWQAYAFTNGVLNTDNTSIFGLSIDFGPFAFLDNFDPNYTPNHDDHMLRYSYRNQPTIIWWNLVRLGESLGELMGAGAKVDDEQFLEKGITEDFAPELIKRAEGIIDRAADEFRAVFLAEYKRLMSARLGLTTQKDEDFENLFSELLNTMESLELDFNQSFRKLCSIKLSDIETEDQRKEVASRFFHHEGVTGFGNTEESARTRVAEWLARWRVRALEDWGERNDSEREAAMKKVNPKFIPKSWVLDELIQRIEKRGEREILHNVMQMALNPFEDSWGWDEKEEERFCGDVPRMSRAMQCSCSS